MTETPDPTARPVPAEADASAHDHLAVNTDATPNPDDGDQADVSQEPTTEDEVEDALAGAA